MADGLERLPAAQRQALALRYYADLPVRDTARPLEVPEARSGTGCTWPMEAIRRVRHARDDGADRSGGGAAAAGPRTDR
ncbi:MAG TPA: sigma factor-like helix-turn-helix DNA-binding protein [Streptomyces sp.]|uniref:sigma factor-like helix-turn-helix DNA-binding protein n=1 Tax=Streptomyces sp. TaxID=1931 RepID=UPI002D739AA2|nr:sigma factor-like helix-turn-helix DNA-binding protein [Streptomyces sp.]HZG02501.1 sigma factor-like helix-turn-helix DNA-binding protein [Streptomyces sp.]